MAGLKFSLRELSGGMGDLGTFLPLAVAMAAAGHLDVGTVLVCAGLMNMATGLLFRQPIPVQPMKAIAAVAITEALGQGELVAAGLIMGVLMIILAITGMVDLIDRVVPRAVVTGIQLGVGLKLATRGVTWIADLPLIGADSVLTTLIACCALLLLLARKQPGALLVFLAGFGLLWLSRPDVFGLARVGPPDVTFAWPTAADWSSGLLRAALPQAPLTILNSVVAVCALSAAYFPGQGIAPRRMAASVGLMNLICAPLGGIPMCHGAGGLAAQYVFGARTGGSVLMLGVAKAAVGLIWGGSLAAAAHAYPAAVLAPLMVLAGIELARASRSTATAGDWTVPLLTAACILGTNTGVGAVVGCVAFGIQELWRRRVGDDPA